MPIRNPFARRTPAEDLPSLTVPNSSAGDLQKKPSFERVDTVGSMASSSTSMRSRRSQDTGDYKMSGKLDLPLFFFFFFLLYFRYLSQL